LDRREAAMSRYRRNQKPDRIINREGIADATDEAIYHALRPLDLVAVEMENRWGVDRLPGLVDPDTAAKFGRAKARLDAAIDSRDPNAVAKRAGVMIRAWRSLDAEATEAGAKQVSKKLRILRDDEGKSFGIAVDEATATAAVRSGDYPDTSIWSLNEVVRVLGAHEMELANAVKETFPGATLGAVGAVRIERGPLDDEIPF
jgi:hypothetical protein